MQKHSTPRILLALSLLLSSRLTQAAPPQPTWGQETVETLSPTRGRICLNGLWKFVPAVGPDATNPHDWGLMPVPGTWATVASGGIYSLPMIAQRGTGATWQGLGGSTTGEAWNALSRAWYERPLQIPAAWAGRAISLRFDRVSTDAQVFVNGRDCGRLTWPGGTLDITKAVTPGQAATLRVLVVAANDQNVEQVFMGTAAGQIETRAATLPTRGITNDVFLEAAPAGARVVSIFAQPSTRRKTLTLDVELENVTQAGDVAFTARCLDEKGRSKRPSPAAPMSQPPRRGKPKR